MEDPYIIFKQAIKNSRIVSMPKNNISTFGNTVYTYYFVGQLDNKKTMVKEGHIKVNRPLFLTPFSQKQYLKGFSQKEQDLLNRLIEDIKINPNVFVEYQFEHIPKHAWTEKNPFPLVLSELKENCKDSFFDVLLTGDGKKWEIPLIKFCLKIIEKSLPINLSEIEERGLFDKNRMPPQVKKEVENRFNMANTIKKVKNLGDFLVEQNIFEIYEEKFFELFSKLKKNI